MIVVIACNRANGQKDLALNKPYTLSTAPNYKNTAGPEDKSALTDGNFTNGFFWNNKATVGWQQVGKVAIEMDLGRSQEFNTVTINTGRNDKASVFYPSNVFVFASDDKSGYQYVGDVVNSADNLSGEYKVQSFQLKTRKVKGRYIKLVVILKGAYFFCDEIQVFNTGGGSSAKMAFSSKPVDEQVDDLLRSDVSGKVASAKNFQYMAAMGTGVAKVASGAAFASQMKQQLGTDFTVNFFNAWDALNVVYKPVRRSQDNVNVKTVINGHSFVGLIVTNLSQGKVNYTINIKGDAGVSAVTLYTVPFLASHMNYQQTADPLQKADNGVSLDAGESRLFLAEITGRRAGTGKTSVSVSDGKTNQGVTISTTIANVKFDDNNFALNTNVWAYLNYPMLQSRKAAAVKDLYEHHINTSVVPPAAIGDMTRNTATGLSDYLAAFGNYKPRNLLLYMNFASPDNMKYCKKNDYMSDGWKSDFKTWYQNASKVIIQGGWDMKDVYVYPYDEIKEEDAGKLISFAKWAKSAIPGIKLYMTVGKLSKGTVEQLNQYMDVMQVYEDYIPSLQTAADKSWMYNTQGNSELLSPYNYYRLKAWKAYVEGYKGVGFWAYADSKDANNFNNVLKTRYMGASTNYSVIYVDGNDIVSSRRWEGFMMGVEDYELLQLYAKKVGAAKAKALAAAVLGAPGDASQADAARDKIITALSE